MGRGTTVRVKIPLTLAIVPALVVTCGGDRYAIPQVSLLELLQIEGNEAGKGVEMVHGVPVCRLRERLLPLVYLDRELQLAGDGVNPTGEKSDAVNIVVLQADERRFGLVVDEIIDTEEIVVKPLGKYLKTAKVFAGSSIMGDGKVALILDVLGLAQRANVVGEGRDARTEEAHAAAGAAAEKQTFLLFTGPGDSRMAIPLSTLARLEEFPIAQVEMSGTQWVTQYRGQILPLVRLNVVLEERRHKLRALQAPPALDSGPIQVLVLNGEGSSFGLVVDQILDIVEDRADVKSAATRAAVLYSVVIEDRITELLDIPAILRGVDGMPVRPDAAMNSVSAN
jgi:two-component system chemotaxis sensor kinase CheA